ncbi:hypothetical protein SY83_12660 [Paenibacillus swuensis]|uniref:Uncharacterized protein n=1 Tax=Paenibacillus swuensis TaxID=1178515 RepID=A0A172TIV2_9BACL|nr:hypothetical protein [Paenibacillus swuensis]ANE46985.1 hypothetical protein SY83_12660 [Paenibacillus swuensis]
MSEGGFNYPNQPNLMDEDVARSLQADKEHQIRNGGGSSLGSQIITLFIAAGILALIVLALNYL